MSGEGEGEQPARGRVSPGVARAFGPSEDRSVFATALAAAMFCFCASRP